MKLTVIRPIYVEGKVLVEGDVFETLEQHGRELVQKGYALTVESAEQPDTGKNTEPKGKGKGK
ncbi:DUF7210 family protein [Atlantibacter subterraneus]|uniref:DUF7210 family protein n=1 Tax=Atlantibacter subterraneus TaxID=255519 RepID=UPI00289BE5C1|nr:hypothetical protein [Atlantibacter subterranea]